MRDCGDASAGSLAQICRTQDLVNLPVSLFLLEVWGLRSATRTREALGCVAQRGRPRVNTICSDCSTSVGKSGRV